MTHESKTSQSLISISGLLLEDDNHAKAPHFPSPTHCVSMELLNADYFQTSVIVPSPGLCAWVPKDSVIAALLVLIAQRISHSWKCSPGYYRPPDVCSSEGLAAGLRHAQLQADKAWFVLGPISPSGVSTILLGADNYLTTLSNGVNSIVQESEISKTRKISGSQRRFKRNRSRAKVIERSYEINKKG